MQRRLAGGGNRKGADIYREKERCQAAFFGVCPCPMPVPVHPTLNVPSNQSRSKRNRQEKEGRRRGV